MEKDLFIVLNSIMKMHASSNNMNLDLTCLEEERLKHLSNETKGSIVFSVFNYYMGLLIGTEPVQMKPAPLAKSKPMKKDEVVEIESFNAKKFLSRSRAENEQYKIKEIVTIFKQLGKPRPAGNKSAILNSLYEIARNMVQCSNTPIESETLDSDSDSDSGPVENLYPSSLKTHLIHRETKFLFEKEPQTVEGKQTYVCIGKFEKDDTVIVPITKEDIITCKELGFHYILPENLDA